MALRCLLFTSDEGTAQSVLQALHDLGVEAEQCPVAVEAVQKVTKNPFNLVIVDWDNQTEAAFLLKTARERKASERPLTLAIVSRDLNVSQALQAGANSILRKPIVVAQVRDSLTSACDLLRSRQDGSLGQAAASSAAATGTALPRDPDASNKTLRAGEFLQSTTAPGAQFVTEADVQNRIQKTIEAAAVADLDPLKDLEPTAAAVQSREVAPQPPPTLSPSEPRGLAWYLKARGAAMASTPPPATSASTELLAYDQMTSEQRPTVASRGAEETTPEPAASAGASAGAYTGSEHKNEKALFAYISGESPESGSKTAKPGPWLSRGILAAALFAVCAVAYIAVPQARWRQNLQILATNAVHFAHNWLNPQATTPAQAPVTHENFGLAGDEYKLPVAQNIPDATTDPTQIRVVPVVDPTARKTNNSAANNEPTVEDTNPTENSSPNSSNPQQTPVQAQEPAEVGPAPTTAAGDPALNSAPPAPPTPSTPAVVESSPVDRATPNPTSPHRDPMQPAAHPNSRPQAVPVSISSKPTAGIPSSLKSQMASMTPEASGNKPVEASLPSIEPVDLPEAAARNLLLEQSEPEYPPAAKGQQGSVVLQVLIARDGSVQEAKFLQGSFAFARAATDAVKQWRFKPYMLNGRPVSTKTLLTLTFKPAS